MDVQTQYSSRVVKSAVLIQKLIERQLQVVCFYPTERCNLACKWCNAEERKNGSIITTERAFLFFREGMKLGLKAVNFSGGGEPTLHPNFSEMVEEARRLGLQTSLVTNGLKLHEIPSSTLRGMAWIRFSLNAGRELYRNVHGIDMYDRAIENLKFLREISRYGPKVSVNCVWSIYSQIDDINSMMRDVAEAGIRRMRIAPEIYGNCGIPQTEIPKEALLQRVPGGLHVTVESPRMVRVPPVCFTQWCKPVVDSNGYIYPCTLNPKPVCKVEDVVSAWKSGKGQVDTNQCVWCHFSDINHFLWDVVNAGSSKDINFL